MSNANQDSLLKPSTRGSAFAVPKNLVLVIGVILILLVMVVFASNMVGDDKAPQPTKLQPQQAAVEEKTPAPEIFEKSIEEQQKSGRALIEKRDLRNAGREAPLPEPLNGAGFPEAGENGEVILPKIPASPKQSQAQVQKEVDAAARELMIRESKILAFETETDTAAAQVSSTDNSAVNDVVKQQKALQDALQSNAKDLLGVTPSSANSGMGGARSQINKAREEREWMKETAQLTEGSEVSRGYAPPSRFVLMQGKTINAVLRTAINTDLPGEIQASVMSDIYDSISGNYLLIPKGSTLVGMYNSDVRVGQDRVNMAFRRLILPNGISVNLAGNIGMDSSGMSGVPGKVNNHYGQLFFVSTLTAIGAIAAQRQQPTSSGTTVNTSAQQTAAGQILTDMNNAIIERNRVIGPTITIPAGIRFVINVARDIELPPYKK